MKFANDYLKELLGVLVCKLKVETVHQDQWVYFGTGDTDIAQGLICTYLTFETNTRLSKYDYESIRIVGFEELGGGIHEYKCECLYGNETRELFSYLGGKRDD